MSAADMDGVPDVSQPEVERGETCTCDFVVRAAGLYWYHPHVMAAAQTGFGLYGALLVDDLVDGVGVADQLTLVLSDIGFDRHVLDSSDTGGLAGMVFGRGGGYALAYGTLLPTLRAASSSSISTVKPSMSSARTVGAMNARRPPIRCSSRPASEWTSS